MILNSTKFGGNRTKDVEVGPDRRTDSYIPSQTMFVGGYNRSSMKTHFTHRLFLKNTQSSLYSPSYNYHHD